MKGFSILLCTLSLSLMAQTQVSIKKTDLWRQGKLIYPMVREKKTGQLISKGCEELQTKCLAYKMLKNQNDAHLSENELSGGKNPGAVLCTKKLKGEVVVLTDSNHNENSFCKFSDGSLLSVSALF